MSLVVRFICLAVLRNRHSDSGASQRDQAESERFDFVAAVFRVRGRF
jgi:hypothetical protein